MIEVKELCKNFDGFDALRNLNLSIHDGSIYGLIGVNGSGKTTLIKHLTGILRPDKGEVLIDGESVYDNEKIKSKIGYIPDDLFFYPGYGLKTMATFYGHVYPNFNWNRYESLVNEFNLNEKCKLSRFSKGMQKQAAFILVMSCMPQYLILDEPVDGLDPLVRRKVWQLIVADVAERQMTVLVSSHNLRELEGLIDTVGIMSGGQVRYEHTDLDELTNENGLLNLEDLFYSEMEGGKQ